MRLFQKGLISLAIVILESALVPICLEVGGVAIGVVPLLFYTSLISTITLIFFSYLDDRGRGFVALLRSKEMLIPMLVAGLSGGAIAQLLQNWGTIGTNPSVSAVVWRSWVIMIAVLSPIALRQRVTKRQYLSVALGFLSVLLIASNGQLLGMSASQLPFIAMLLGSGLMVAVSTLMLKRYNPSTSGFVLLASLASFVFSIPLMLVYGHGLALSMPLNALFSMLFLGVIDAGLGVVLYYHSFKTFSTAFTGSALLSIPFLTILFSFFLLGTPIEWYYVVAALVLGVAIFIAGSDAAKAPEHIKSKSENPAEGLWIFDITSAFINNRAPEIYGAVQGDSKALAIRLGEAEFDEVTHGNIFDKYGCIAFTAADPHEEVKSEEIEYVREMMELGEHEDALICIGKPEHAERAFEEFMALHRGNL